MSVDLSFLYQNMKSLYPGEVARLSAIWSDSRNTEFVHGLGEEEFVLSELPGLLKNRDAQSLDLAKFDAETKDDQSTSTMALFGDLSNKAIRLDHCATGFKGLDHALSGGFTPGVHYIGAVSSLGKSTFALQMAEEMSARGYHVLYFTLEMTPLDLSTKLLSRRTFLDTVADPDRSCWAKTFSALRSSPCLDAMSQGERNLIAQCQHIQMERQQNLRFIFRSQFKLSVPYVDSYVNSYIQLYKRRPVVIVDYLQLLGVPDEDARKLTTDKQQVDYHVSKLRLVASKYKVPVLVISSFNRQNYNAKASYQSFKDSGEIEYGSDTLMAIQPEGVGCKDFDIDQAKNAYPRKVQLVILKQRYGPSNFVLNFDYYTRFNHFAEQDGEWEKLKANDLAPFDDKDDKEAEQLSLEPEVDKDGFEFI